MFNLPINDQGWGLFSRLIGNFRRSPQGARATRYFVFLFFFLVILNGLNIFSSYVGRDFMTALADRNAPLFVQMATIYALVFLLLTLVAVILRFCEERLGLLWRTFMTQAFIDIYLSPLVYYRMNDELIRQSGVEHPDQRIAEDVRTFTTVTLSFILMSMNGLFTVLAFSGVLWMINPWLFGAAIAYATIGTLLTILIGGRLVDLNSRQLDREATFRSSLIHVRERAESIMLLHHEGRLKPRILAQFNQLAENWKTIIGVNRNLGLFTTGYNYLIQILPVVLIAPLYIKGKVEFGVVTQSVTAFAMLVGAFSLIVTQFQSLSSFAAVIQRLITLWYLIEVSQGDTVSSIRLVESDEAIAWDNLSLFSAMDKRPLIKDLTLTIPIGLRVLVIGDETARDALFKATAGIYEAGTGTVNRPELEQIRFLPDRPYIPPGTLRQALVSARLEKTLDDQRIHSMIHLVGLTDVLARAGGLDVEQDWDGLLSPHEQRLVSFARILITQPRYVVMANPFKDMDLEIRAKVAALFKQSDVTFILMGSQDAGGMNPDSAAFDAVLTLNADASWNWTVTH